MGNKGFFKKSSVRWKCHIKERHNMKKIILAHSEKPRDQEVLKNV